MRHEDVPAKCDQQPDGSWKCKACKSDIMGADGEKFWILKLDTLYPAGYNVKLGVTWTAETKIKASCAQSGKPKSAEHRRKLSESAKLRRHSEQRKQDLRFFTPEQAAQVRILNESGHSQNALAKKFGTSRATIQRVLRKRAGYT